jgi:Arc/MetJ-type ribon-helix-helix transcriptional regulator
MSVISINVRPREADYVRQKVASGQYASEGDLIAEAIELFRSGDPLENLNRDQIRNLLADGMADIASGRVIEWNATEMAMLEQEVFASSRDDV